MQRALDTLRDLLLLYFSWMDVPALAFYLERLPAFLSVNTQRTATIANPPRS